MEFLKKIVPTAGLLIGIVFVAIGGTMLVRNGLKIAFSESVPYSPANMCESRLVPADVKQESKTPEEVEDCIARIITEEESRFIQDKIDGIIDSIAFLSVGIIFWIIFRKRKED